MDRTKVAVNTAVTQLKDQYPAIETADLAALVQSFYMTWEGGRVVPVQADGLNNAAPPSPTRIFTSFYTPRHATVTTILQI